MSCLLSFCSLEADAYSSSSSYGSNNDGACQHDHMPCTPCATWWQVGPNSYPAATWHLTLTLNLLRQALWALCPAAVASGGVSQGRMCLYLSGPAAGSPHWQTAASPAWK